MIKTVCRLSRVALLAIGLLPPVSASQSNQPTAPAQAAQPVPVIDGGIGPCSLELTVSAADGKPAAAAKVKVHIAYGFGGFHKLDLEAGANSDGKVRFTGLPSRVRRSQLEFEASKGDLVGTITYDPATACQAKRDIKLATPNPSPN
ncbi:MAG TPA: hypothetical protein VGV15_15030 [Terriglobales bacterium]|nr:hypothetical protein [Terriglobales bacterium]